MTVHIFQMDNKLKSALGGAALLTLGAQSAQAETVEQAQQRLAQLIAEAPEAIVQVIQSGEGCDISILNTALETEDYAPYEQCSNIEIAQANVREAKLDQSITTKSEALADTKTERVNIKQDNIVLSKKVTALTASNDAREKEILANLLD